MVYNWFVGVYMMIGDGLEIFKWIMDFFDFFVMVMFVKEM